MAKLTLDTIAKYDEISKINSNFDKIEAELQNKVFYRNNPVGEPNTIEGDVDFNNKNVFNVNEIRASDLLIDGVNITTSVATSQTAAAASATAAASSAASASSSASAAATSASQAAAAADFIPEIANYAALRAYSGPITEFHLKGHTSVLDGGAGVFRVDAADTASADNGGTILVDAVGRRWKREFTSEVESEWFGIGAGGDDTSAVNAAIAAAGVGGQVKFKGLASISGTVRPLKRQKWVGIGDDATFYFTASTAVPAIEFIAASEFASIENIGFRSVAGFTGQAVKFNAALNCRIDGMLITNILNATGVQLSGGSFYNEVRNVRVTSASVALHLTGTSPNCPNNNIIDNFDIYGTIATGLLCDGNPSMVQLNNFICEAECSVSHLKVTNAGVTLIFNNPRFEGTATPSEGFFNIVSGAAVYFDGKKFNIEKATHGSLASDLDELRFRNIFNLVKDPLFIADIGTAPDGWSITFGSASSVVKSTTTPGVSAFGNSLEIVTSAAQTNMSYALSSGAMQSLFRGKKVTARALTYFSSPGTKSTVLARFDGGASVAGSQVSENLVANRWGVHSATLTVPSDATSITFTISCEGNGGTFRLYSPVLEVDGSFYAMGAPTQQMPWFYNGLFVGDLGLRVVYASAAPVSGTWKRGDRTVNRLPSVGQPKSWVCTVSGTPGTWVSEGNL